MVEEVTLDSSVLVSAFVEDDEFRSVARKVMERIFRGSIGRLLVPSFLLRFVDRSPEELVWRMRSRRLEIFHLCEMA